MPPQIVITAVLAVVGIAFVTTIGPADAGQPDAVAAVTHLVQFDDPPLAGYAGASRSATGPARGARLDPGSAGSQAYRSLLRGRRTTILRAAGIDPGRIVGEYDTVLNGVAARLTPAEVAALRRASGVRQVWRNDSIDVDTVSTPAFLGLDGPTGTWATQFGDPARAGEGVIVGVLDTGVYPEHPSLAPLPEPRPDAAVIAGKWQGTCAAGEEAPVTCNNKLIGARWYPPTDVAVIEAEFGSPRDYNGHGTHVAGTSTGNHGVPADLNNQPVGSASGIAPAARLAVYKVCWQFSLRVSCPVAGIVQAIDDAVTDGVDVLNYSIADLARGLVTGPIHDAFRQAAAAGVFVAASAGNDGAAGTVQSNTPWVTTVASGSHDRGAFPRPNQPPPPPVRAPRIADSSSRGPAAAANGDLLKPDIAAPGVLVLAAAPPEAPGNFGNIFAVLSGTSMATPHIAGIAALLRSLHPQWGPMAVKSAIVTTAGQLDNTGQPIQSRGGDATTLDLGAGHVRPGAAFDPGLVYDSTSAEWARFICGAGEVPSELGGPEVCQQLEPLDPSDLNHPTIAIGDLLAAQTVTRTVTNVGSGADTYTAVVQAPPGYTVDVTPAVLTVEQDQSATFTVQVTRTTAATGTWSFGSLTWSDPAGHRVRSPIALRSAG